MIDPITSTFGLWLLKKGAGWIGQEALDALGKEGRRKLAAATLFKEWDDRLGPSRLWLMRANPEWAAIGQARRPFRLGIMSPTADDAEAAFHANRILNFFEDLQGAIESRLVELSDLTEICETVDLWWSRLQPLHEFVRKDRRSKGWHIAQKLVANIKRAHHGSKAGPWNPTK